MKIPFIDFSRYIAANRQAIMNAVGRVIDRGYFILGPELQEFEGLFASSVGADWAAGCANGTDAIELSLRALGVGLGDEVVTTPLTAMPTLMAIAATGAKINMVDVELASGLMDPDELRLVMSKNVKCIVPVHLYGQLCDMPKIARLAREFSAYLLEDCAQAFGTEGYGGRAGDWAELSSWSFYPTKNLGAFGDAGAITGRDPKLLGEIIKLRNYGQSSIYHHEEIGRNSRLDEIQAAILKLKLASISFEQMKRRELALFYRERLTGKVEIVSGANDIKGCNYHLFVIRSPYQRMRFQAALLDSGVSTLVHYPTPAHLQPAFANLGYKRGDFGNAEKLSESVVSLPLHPFLTHEEAEYVVKKISALV